MVLLANIVAAIWLLLTILQCFAGRAYVDSFIVASIWLFGSAILSELQSQRRERGAPR